MNAQASFTLDEKEVLLHNYFQRGLRDFRKFDKVRLSYMYNLFKEVVDDERKGW